MRKFLLIIPALALAGCGSGTNPVPVTPESSGSDCPTRLNEAIRGWQTVCDPTTGIGYRCLYHFDENGGKSAGGPVLYCNPVGG